MPSSTLRRDTTVEILHGRTQALCIWVPVHRLGIGLASVLAHVWMTVRVLTMLERVPPIVLLASADQPWRVACAERLLQSGCDVHTAATGFRAMDDLRKHQYDLVVFDDSMPDLSIFELHLNIRDIAYNAPRQLIATADGSRKEHVRIRNGSDVDVGTPEEVFRRLLPAVQKMRLHQN